MALYVATGIHEIDAFQFILR